MAPDASRPAGARAAGLAAAVLALAAAAAWLWLLKSPVTGAAGSLPGMPGMAGMTAPGPSPSLSAVAAPALAMTAAMMIPVAAPVLFRRRSGRLAFALGYLAPWLALAIALTWVGMAPWVRTLSADRRFAAAVLAAVGLFQLTPVKAWALGACTRLAMAPTTASAPAAAILGLRYGARCLASGGALMIAATVLDAMSPAWMAALALVMLAEKTRAGRAVARATGVVLVIAAGLQLAI